MDPELIAWLIAGWAWTGDVASSMGVNVIWYERVSPRLLDFILGSLSAGSARPGSEAAKRSAGPDGAELDGLPDGAVFTVEETAAILKVTASTIRRMALERKLTSLRLDGETRIPRRALLACLRGMTLGEFEDFLATRARS